MESPAIPRPLPLGRQRWFVVGLLVFFVGVSVQYSLKVSHADRHTDRDNRSAFLRWREQILELDQGVDIWAKYNYPNPPIMALLLEPFVLLPPLTGSLLWFYAKVGMTVAAVFWAFRLIETPKGGEPCGTPLGEPPATSQDGRFPAWGKALAVVLTLRPIMGDLTHGNVNLFILLLVVGVLYAYRRGRDLLAGTSLALGIACKVTPALFIPYFAWKRNWRVLAGCGVGLVLFLWLVPGLVLGMGKNAEYLGAWVKGMILPFVAGGEVWTEYENQSLPGVVFRLTTDSPSFTAYIDDVKTPLEYHNLLSLPKATAGWLVKGCMASFALLVVWVCRTPRALRKGWQPAAEFSLVVLGMLLFSERTWKHHCVTLLLPFGVIAYYLSACRPGRALRNYLIATVVLVVLLMTATGSIPVGPLERAGRLAQVYGAYLWAHLLLVAALVVLLRRDRAVIGDLLHHHSPLTTHHSPLLQASISETTEAPGTRGSGRPVRSVSVVSESIPSR
jgi:hypothetical protein